MAKRRVKKRWLFLGLLAIGVFGLSFVESAKVFSQQTPEIPTAYQDYHRGEEQTLLTFPEWWLVYSSREYADFIVDQPPSAFPFFGHIGQFWSGYSTILKLTDQYPVNIDYHVMVLVIGVSTTVEYGLRGIYEATIGRASEWLGGHDTQEDLLAAKVAHDYVDFIVVDPWYRFDFVTPLKAVWTDTDFTGPYIIRKTERKVVLTTEYGIKAAYAWLLGKATALSYAPPSPYTMTELKTATAVDNFPQVKDDRGHTIAALPRYDAFSAAATQLAERHVEFAAIAGNDGIILLTVLSTNPDFAPEEGKIVFRQPILTVPGTTRFGVTTEVKTLAPLLQKLNKSGARLEHIYDY